ncbi:lysophospholipid acyltransferase family protein [Rubrivirga sp.]|uniref:lysophospholipid acyltransferase family protein n=1 Tax=Rubrivirga sp. TaxID=1885344 RepID=UPI003B52B317
MPVSARSRLFLDPPSATLAHRLWFGWALVWATVFTVTMSPCVVLHSAFRPTARTLRAWMRPWARFVLGMWGVRVRVEARAPVPDGPVVFVSNHVNSLDIPAAMVGLPRPFLYVARHEIRAWPMVGWVLDKTACLFIDRSNARRSVADLRRVAERIRGGDSVLLYPEGGRSHGHALNPFMRGPFVLAIESGVPVVPVTVVGHAGLLSTTEKLARPGETRFVLGEPIPTAGLTRADAADLQERLRAVIAGELAAFGPAE